MARAKVNKVGVPLIVAPSDIKVLDVGSSTPVETPVIPMFASVADKDSFFDEFGKQPYYRALIRDAFPAKSVTFEEIKLIAEKGRAHLRALAGRYDDGKEGGCILGVECLNPNYKFIPKASHVFDWTNPLVPKRAVLKVKGDGDVFATLLKVTDTNGVKTYHLLDDGHVTTREDNKTVVLPDNEAEIVKEAAEPVYLFDGHYYADEERLEVVGPVCHLCITRAQELAEKEKARKPRFTSKATADDMIARAKGKREWQAKREERLAQTDVTIGSRFVKKIPTDGGPGSRKTRKTQGWSGSGYSK